MANRIASAMAIAIKGCHVRDMAHSTPLHSTTRADVVGGSSVANQVQIVKAVEGHRERRIGFGEIG